MAYKNDFKLLIVANKQSSLVRRQIQHMIKYRYVPFTFGKAKYNQRSGH